MFDAILLASYGGPENIDDINPFLDRILTGKRVPPARCAAIFERYERFNGVSPLPGECRRFLDRLAEAFAADATSAKASNPSNSSADAAPQPSSPPRIYWGNLYAPPTFDDAFAQMEADGVRRLFVFPTSAFGSPQSCRRYIDAVRDAVRRRSPEFAARLQIAQTPPFFDLPAYRRAAADALLTALAWDELESNPFDDAAPFPKTAQTSQPSQSSQTSDAAGFADAADINVDVPNDAPPKRLILFSAHSLPVVDASKSAYSAQLLAAATAVLRSTLDAPGFSGQVAEEKNAVEDADATRRFPARDFVLSAADFAPELRRRLRSVGLDAALAFQSRSGSPGTPWLEPSVADFVRRYKEENPSWNRLLVSPIGFFFENMETVFDLDVELKEVCDELGVSYRRAACCGADNRLVCAVRDLARREPSDFPVCRSAPGACDFSCR
ncbi:MAG: ferrochelatase, partial [Thermoguttaceae bacterium]|nr:ferrochelatase [Thermoguttaceae bacterium]